MPRMRIISWVLFTLALAFFFVQDFRWALQMPYVEWKNSPDALEVPPDRLQALAERARQSRDAQSLAFVALHISTDGGRDIALANEAVAMDPSLTWIYWQLAYRHRVYAGPGQHAWESAFVPVLNDWMAKLQASDPRNAAPYLLEAEAIRDRTKDFLDPTAKQDATHLAVLDKQADWVAAMEKAYTAPRYDSYYVRRFELERKVLRANGWVRPDKVLLLAFSFPIPGLMNIRTYANYKTLYLAPKAESEKHHDQALRQYYTTAVFGQRMQVEGATLIEQIMGASLDHIAAEPLEAALRKDGQNAQADLVAFSFRRFRRDHPASGTRDPLASSSNQLWAILAAHILALLVAFFGGATLLCALYLNAKRWIRVQKRGHIFQFVTGTVNYLAVLLFVSCLGLFLVCVPYATNLNYYMTAPGEVRNLEPLFTNAYPFLASDWQWGDSDLLLSPVHHYLRWAGLGLVLLALLGWIKKRMGGAAPAPAK